MKNILPNLDLLEEVEKIAKNVNILADEKKKGVFKKYPITFSLLSLSGFALIMYGLEGTFNKIPILQNRPTTVLIMGVLILITTGTVFKRLNK